MARLTGNGVLFDLLDPNNKIDSFYWMYPAGTKKLFFQATAPTGWTQDTTYGDRALRVVSGTGGGVGGNTTFVTALSSSSGNINVGINTTLPVEIPPGAGTFIGNHTLSITELPDHVHPSIYGPTGGANATPFSNTGARTIDGNTATGTMNESTGGGAHNHPFSGSTTINTTFSDGIDLGVQYVDVIICTLN
jgi:hypothetical protein